MRNHCIGICVLICLVLFSGCARKQTVNTPDGKVTVTEKAGGQSVEVKTDTDSVKVSTDKRTVTEAELGLPVYPGSVVDATSEYEGQEEGGQKLSTHYILSTKDSFDKVYAYYKANLKNITQQVKQNMGDNQMALFTTKRADGAPVSITITNDNEEKLTRIQVMQVGDTP